MVGTENRLIPPRSAGIRVPRSGVPAYHVVPVYTMSDHHVLITGATRGLGEALALAFADQGGAVSICGRSPDRLREIEARARELASHRGSGAERCRATALDVRDATRVAEWIASAVHSFGPPTALINNASVLGPREPLEQVEIADWEEVLEVNLTGVFVTCRATIPEMRRAGGGSIINVSSGAAIPPRANWGPYAVSKSAVDAFSMNLASELEDTAIRVNIVDPGAMRTGMRAAAYPAEDPARVKEPRAITPLFLWLAGPSSRGVTGRRFRADEWLSGRGGAGMPIAPAEPSEGRFGND
jgi:NAD(P)-dependent dehydrogenase (short-subunit alcohol dehydrogenase family)